MKHTTALLLALALGASSVSALAQARFEWIDNTTGKKVFSDRPPAGGRESVRGFVDHAPGASAPKGNAPAEAASAPGVDKELEAKKRAAEEAEAAQQKEAERQRAAQRADNCKRARQARESLDSGVPMATRDDEKGEPVLLTDAQRAEESKRVQSIIEDNCN